MHHTNRYSQIVFAFVLLVGLFGHVSAASAQATTLHDAAAQLTKELSDDPDVQKITGEHIVIAPFENINGKGDAVPRILQEMFTTDFIKAKHFKVLERDQLQSALDELHFQLSDLADPAKAKKIGKLAGAAYVLLGSISDTGSSTSINARIVSIESGESIAAEDEDIKTGDAPLAASGLNPALTTTTPPATAPTDNTPAIDLNANATPTTAGEFTGKKDNFGLLGGTGFKIAWREDLGKNPVYAFSAGDVLGDGTTRLVEYMPLLDNSYENVLRISKWEDGNFNQKWQSENINSGGGFEPVVCVSLTGQKSGFVTLSDHNTVGPTCKAWRWDGSTYSNALDTDSSPFYKDYQPPVLKWLSGFEFLSESFSVDGICLRSINKNANTIDFSSSTNLSFNCRPCGLPTAGDFDGHGNIEVATVAVSGKTADRPIEIWGKDGRKAVTTKKYGNRLTTWNPAASKFPYIVACKNKADEQGENNGGYVYFIQWNGESYDEVWHSNKMEDAVIDMQVCDPKSEGKTGLVILSRQDKNYFLTKIVLAK